MKKIMIKVILSCLIFCSASILGFSQDSNDESSGSQTIYYNPSSSNDGVTTKAEIRWKIYRYMTEVVFMLNLRLEMTGSEVYVEGKQYSKNELGDVWKKIKVQESSFRLKADLAVMHGRALGTGTLTLWQEGTMTGLDGYFGLSNSDLRGLYDGGGGNLELRNFKLTELSFEGLYDVKQYIRQKEREERQAKELEQKAEAAYEKASRLYGNREWEASIKSYEEALKLSPDHYQAPMARFNISQAEIRIRNILEQQQKADSLYSQAESSFRSRNWQASINLYREALNFAPEHSKSAEAQRNIRTAEEELVKIEEKEKTEAEAADNAFRRADELYNDKFWEEAVKAYQSAIEKYPDDYRTSSAGRRINYARQYIAKEEAEEKARIDAEREQAEREERLEAARIAQQNQLNQAQMEARQREALRRQLASSITGVIDTFDFGYIGFSGGLMFREDYNEDYFAESEYSIIPGINITARGGWLMNDEGSLINMGLGPVIGAGYYFGDELTYQEIYPQEMVTENDTLMIYRAGLTMMVILPYIRIDTEFSYGWVLPYESLFDGEAMIISVILGFGNFNIGMDLMFMEFDDEYYEYADEYNSGTRPVITLGFEF